jgi:hypothetical protein
MSHGGCAFPITRLSLLYSKARILVPPVSCASSGSGPPRNATMIEQWLGYDDTKTILKDGFSFLRLFT